jgi:hypothetical protein
MLIEDHRGLYKTRNCKMGRFQKSTIFDNVFGGLICLVDVLLAVEDVPKVYKVMIDCGGRFWEFVSTRPTKVIWTLGK